MFAPFVCRKYFGDFCVAFWLYQYAIERASKCERTRFFCQCARCTQAVAVAAASGRRSIDSENTAKTKQKKGNALFIDCFSENDSFDQPSPSLCCSHCSKRNNDGRDNFFSRVANIGRRSKSSHFGKRRLRFCVRVAAQFRFSCHFYASTHARLCAIAFIIARVTACKRDFDYRERGRCFLPSHQPANAYFSI